MKPATAGMAARIMAYLVNMSAMVRFSPLITSHSLAGVSRMFFALSTRFIFSSYEFDSDIDTAKETKSQSKTSPGPGRPGGRRGSRAERCPSRRRGRRAPCAPAWKSGQAGEHQPDVAPVPQRVADDGPAGQQLVEQHDDQGQDQREDQGNEGVEADGLRPVAALEVRQGAGDAAGGAGNGGHGPQRAKDYAARTGDPVVGQKRKQQNAASSPRASSRGQ